MLFKLRMQTSKIYPDKTDSSHENYIFVNMCISFNRKHQKQNTKSSVNEDNCNCNAEIHFACNLRVKNDILLFD